jgi:CRP-like cAMP-binding protein
MSIKGIFPIDKWNFDSQSILRDLPANDYEQLMRNASEKEYIKGEIIFREGANPTGIYYIREGKIKKYKVDNLGKEQIIYVGNQGELIGYHAVLAAEPYPDAAAALEQSIISFIPANDFLEVIDQSPDLSRRLLKTLSHEFGVLANSISVFAQRPVRERLAIALLVLREKFKNEPADGGAIEINVSREDIANMVGATRENVVRLLRDFKDEKLIEAKGRRIRVLDVLGLVTVSNYT